MPGGVIILLAALAARPSGVYAARGAAVDTKRRELNRIQKDLEAARRQIEEFRALEESLNKELGRLRGKDQQARRRLEQLQARMREAESHRGELKQRLGALGHASELWRGLAADEARGLIAARAGREESFGSASLWPDAYRRAALLEKLDLLAGLQGFSRKTALAEAEARRQALALQRRRERAERQRRLGAEELERKMAAAAQAQQNMLAAQTRAKELEENARALTRLLRNLERRQARPGRATRWEVARHSLPWPAAGRVIQGFGRQKNMELGTWLIHQGILLETVAEAPVSPVHAGRVIFAGPFRSYGRVLILDHGASFFSIYGELSSVLKDKGALVAPGEVIATAGPRPGGKGGLYFEIRRGTEALDPRSWLKKL